MNAKRAPTRPSLDALAKKIKAGETIDCAWELFRLQHFPGIDAQDAAEELGRWAKAAKVRARFHEIKVSAFDVIYVKISG